MTGHRRRARRTNAERTASTRTRLLDATVGCLADRGYGATTTTEVCRRSGVSRGALLHHFPSRQELVLAAVAHVIERRIDEVRSISVQVPEGPDRVDVTLDLLWTTMRSATFTASFELFVAARTDEDLRPAVAELGDRLDRDLVDAATSLFPPPASNVDRFMYETVVRMVFAVLYGLAFEGFSARPGGEANAVAVLFLLKRLVRVFEASVRDRAIQEVLMRLLGDASPAVDPTTSIAPDGVIGAGDSMDRALAALLRESRAAGAAATEAAEFDDESDVDADFDAGADVGHAAANDRAPGGSS